MNIISWHHKGFSAVEVMIALIVASLFLFTGYQLFSIIYDAQLYARARSEASNIAYSHLRSRSVDPMLCNGPELVKNHIPHEGQKLPNLRIQSRMSCPYGQNVMLVKIEVTVDYMVNGVAQKEQQAIYVDK